MPTNIGVTRDDTFINKQASGYLFGKEVKSTGQVLDTPDSIQTFGRVIKSNFTKAVATTNEADQGGSSFSAASTTTCTLENTIAQRDKVHLDLPEAMYGRYIQYTQELTAKKMGASVNKIQYLIVACATPDGSQTIDGTNMYPVHKHSCSAVSGSDITISHSVTGTFGAQTLSTTLAAGKYHVIVEMTAA